MSVASATKKDLATGDPAQIWRDGHWLPGWIVLGLHDGKAWSERAGKGLEGIRVRSLMDGAEVVVPKDSIKPMHGKILSAREFIPRAFRAESPLDLKLQLWGLTRVQRVAVWRKMRSGHREKVWQTLGFPPLAEVELWDGLKAKKFARGGVWDWMGPPYCEISQPVPGNIVTPEPAPSEDLSPGPLARINQLTLFPEDGDPWSK